MRRQQPEGNKTHTVPHRMRCHQNARPSIWWAQQPIVRACEYYTHEKCTRSWCACVWVCVFVEWERRVRENAWNTWTKRTDCWNRTPFREIWSEVRACEWTTLTPNILLWKCVCLCMCVDMCESVYSCARPNSRKEITALQQQPRTRARREWARGTETETVAIKLSAIFALSSCV